MATHADKTAPTVDIHAHIELPEVVEWAAGHTVPFSPPPAHLMDEVMRGRMRAQALKIKSCLTDIGARLERMDADGVDIQVLSASNVSQPTLWAPAGDALVMERKLNDAIAETVARHPARFRGLGGVPMQDTRLAVSELGRCVNDLGLAGVQISSHAGGSELGAQANWPFWEKAEELGAFVFIHPSGMTDRRYGPWQTWATLGQVFEEAMAMTSLMFEGVMDRFEDLNICIAHGGGFLPFNPGRLQRMVTDMPSWAAGMKHPPSHYLKCFFYDSGVLFPDILADLVGRVGAERILFGSDFPFVLDAPRNFVGAAPGLDEAEREAIIHGNAARLLNI